MVPFALLIASIGCYTPETAPLEEGATHEAMSGVDLDDSEWARNFPAAADLAILLDTNDKAVIHFDYRTDRGERFLPASWLNRVRKAYDGTFAEDAIERENADQDWRLVSIRISPCAPIGIQPSVDIDEWCWPAVRLVWQPVIEHHRLAWGPIVDYYADDRAIHAIYPVAPRNPSGDRIAGEWREVVSAHLADNRAPSQLQPHLATGFRAVRDASAQTVLGALHSLRDPRLSGGDYEALDIRPETYDRPEIQARFHAGLRWFLNEFAQPGDLEELTSFSMPEGREPANRVDWSRGY